jgi:hypothetical protein
VANCTSPINYPLATSIFYIFFFHTPPPFLLHALSPLIYPLNLLSLLINFHHNDLLKLWVVFHEPLFSLYHFVPLREGTCFFPSSICYIVSKEFIKPLKIWHISMFIFGVFVVSFLKCIQMLTWIWRMVLDHSKYLHKMLDQQII